MLNTRIQVDGVRTAEGCEGVTGAIIRANYLSGIDGSSGRTCFS